MSLDLLAWSNVWPTGAPFVATAALCTALMPMPATCAYYRVVSACE